MRTQTNRFCILLTIPLFLLAYSSSYGKSLTKCAANGDNGCLEALIAKGEDINAYDKRGWTPLLWAVYYERPETVKFLIEKGANVNARTMNDYRSVKKNSTALIISSMYDTTDIADLLIKNGAILDAVNWDGQSAYSIALYNESADMLKLLGKDPFEISSSKKEENAIEARTGNDDSKTEIKRHQQIGFGFSFGTPSYLNFVTGGFFSHYGIQISLLGFSLSHGGFIVFQFDIMYLFKNDLELKYGLSLMVDLMPFQPWQMKYNPWHGIGLSWYTNFHGIFIEPGVSFGPEKGFKQKKDEYPLPRGKLKYYPMVNVGYMRLF